MGNLSKVADRQEDYRGLLRTKPGSGGPTLEEESLKGAVKQYGEDSIVNLAIILEDMNSDHTDEVIVMDAVRILDHLDTLGMEIRFKNGRPGFPE